MATTVDWPFRQFGTQSLGLLEEAQFNSFPNLFLSYSTSFLLTAQFRVLKLYSGYNIEAKRVDVLLRKRVVGISPPKRLRRKDELEQYFSEVIHRKI